MSYKTKGTVPSLLAEARKGWAMGTMTVSGFPEVDTILMWHMEILKKKKKPSCLGTQNVKLTASQFNI